MNNIAEGFERTTDADKARFFDIAEGSFGEVRSMYYVAEDVGYTSIAIARHAGCPAIAVCLTFRPIDYSLTSPVAIT